MENSMQELNPEVGEKTFTQEQVNAIIGERLAKERAKGEVSIAQREQELAKRELILTAREKAGEMGLPAEIVDALNISDTETLEKSLETIKKIMNDTEKKASSRFVQPYTPARGTAPEPDSVRRAMGLEW